MYYTHYRDFYTKKDHFFSPHMVFYLISGLDSTMSLSGFITVTHLPTADIQSQTYKQRARVFITLSLDISYCLTSLSMDNIEEKYMDSK